MPRDPHSARGGTPAADTSAGASRSAGSTGPQSGNTGKEALRDPKRPVGEAIYARLVARCSDGNSNTIKAPERAAGNGSGSSAVLSAARQRMIRAVPRNFTRPGSMSAGRQGRNGIMDVADSRRSPGGICRGFRPQYLAEAAQAGLEPSLPSDRSGLINRKRPIIRFTCSDTSSWRK